MTGLAELLADSGPVGREVKIDGKKAKVFFRRLTGAEQEILLKGQKIQHKAGETTVEIDLCENEKQRHQLVFYSVVNQDGSQYFDKLEQVKKLPASKVRVLSDHAQIVNGQDDDAGKS